MKRLFKSRSESVKSLSESPKEPSVGLPPSIRMARSFHQRAEYMSLASLIHKMPLLAIEELLTVIPSGMFIDKMPSSLPVIEVLFSRYLVANFSIEKLHPQAFLRRAISVLRYRSAPAFGSHISQITNIVRVIQLKSPRHLNHLKKYFNSVNASHKHLERNDCIRNSDGVSFGSIEQYTSFTFASLVKQIKVIMLVYNGVGRFVLGEPDTPVTLSLLEERSSRQKNLLKIFQPINKFKEFSKVLCKLSSCVFNDEIVLHQVGIYRKICIGLF